MKKIFLFSVLLFFSILIFGQDRYVTIDADGFTNIRKKPNAKSEIIGKVTKYQIFASPEALCGSFTDSNEAKKIDWDNKNRMPVLISGYPGLKIGYVFRKKVKLINELPILKMDDNGTFTSKDLQICMTMDTIDTKENFKIKKISSEFKKKKYNFPQEAIDRIEFQQYPFIQNISRNIDTNMYYAGKELYYLVMNQDDYFTLWVIERGKFIRKESWLQCM